ncbi:3-oxoacyl-ACP reductase [Halobacteriales archaeon QS_8_69_26]|nr:MAG: 3-oxoacyl-ACP reductase [Halobacteriales archaeon QS_8_69_26]
MSTEQFGVDGDVAIVTGASQGIGKVIAERFADDGLNVVVCSRDMDNVGPVADGINDSDRPGSANPLECDVTDREDVESLVEATVEEFGGLDVLVNNAGASFMVGFDDLSPNGWSTVVEINLTGTYHCCQVAAPHLKEGGGSVVNFSSVAGQQGAPYMSHYAAAKAAVINLTSTMAFEWAGDGVRVNCVAPGFVATPGLASQMGISADDVDRDEVDRRIGLSEEIADVTQFLASRAASFVTGETVSPRGVPDIMEEPEL